MAEIAIAGGGPAGSACAALLARGHDVTVYEEHPRIGEPVQCAGLLSDAAVRLSGVSPDIFSTLYGAEVVFPNGSKMTVRSQSPKARTVDRRQFDSLLAERAADVGAVYRTGERVQSLAVGKDGVDVTTSSGRHSADMVVGADGHSSVVATSLGGNAPPEYLKGIQADVARRTDLDDMFRIRLGSRYAPGFFTWEIPCGDFTRIGLCVSWSEDPPVKYLKRLLSDLGEEYRVTSMSCGKIPLGRRRTISSDRVMLIGDAASQVKPVSAGGIYPSMVAAPILADVAGRALESGDLSAGVLKEYDRRFYGTMGKELRNGYRLRRMFVRMDDDDLDRAGAYASRERVGRVLDGMDIDDPSAVMPRLMRDPRTAIPGVYTLMRCLV